MATEPSLRQAGVATLPGLLAPLALSLSLAASGLACSQVRAPRPGQPAVLQASRSSSPLPGTATDPRELRLTLPAQTYLRVAVLSTATEVVVRLQGPDGQAAEELQLPGGGVEPAHLSWITAAAGDYRFTVGPRNPQGPAGAHALALEEERPAGPCDEARRRAERAVLAARRELSGPNPEAAAAGARALLAPAAGDAAAVGEREGVVAVQLGAARAAAQPESGAATATGLFEQALALARELGDRAAEAAAWQELAALLPDGRRLGALRAALELRRQLGDEGAQATLLYLEGYHHETHGEMPQAVRSYQQALALHWRTDDAYGQALTLCELGSSYGRMGDPDRARAYLDVGYERGREAGDLETQAFALREMARIDMDLGELQAAHDEYARVHDLLAAGRSNPTAGTASESAWAQQGVAASLLFLGEANEARQEYGEALRSFEALHDPRGLAGVLLGLGSAFEAEHDAARALEHFQKAMDLIRANDLRSLEGLALYDLG